MTNKNNFLISEQIQETIEKLYFRINDRFPNSGLSNVCKILHTISLETNNTLKWIAKPNYLIRCGTYAIIIIIALMTTYSVSIINVTAETLGISDLIQMTSSALQGLAIAGAGLLFIVTFENRRKRKKIISAINRLRCIAHIIDSHQLTKDPDSISKISMPTTHSPKRTLNKYQLSRYLNYCSEMLSLTSKLGFLYVQKFPDPIATNVVNDLEELTTGLSRKIWQKIIIINSKSNS
jgi:hypothetical protein